MCNIEWFYCTTDEEGETDNGESDSQMEVVVISTTSEFRMRDVQKPVYPQSHTGTVAAVCVLAVIGGVYWHHRRQVNISYTCV